MIRAIRNGIFAAVMGAALTACVSYPLPAEVSAYSIGNSDAPRFVEASPAESCVPYARRISGIQIFGDAHTWWDQAAGRYVRESRPITGALLVLHNYSGAKTGHLALVTRVISSREIRVDHANWLNDGNVYLNSPVIDVSPNNDWSVVHVFNNRAGHMGVKDFPVQGFISATRVAAAS